MNNESLITEQDVEQLAAAKKNGTIIKFVREFIEAEPHYAEAFGRQLDTLYDTVTAAGVCEEQRSAIFKELHRTLALNIYLIRSSALRLIDGLLPTDSEETR